MVIFVRIVFAAIGAALGYSGALLLLNSGAMAGFFDETYTVGLFIIVGFLVGVAVGPPIVQGLKRGSKRATQILLKTPTHELVGV